MLDFFIVLEAIHSTALSHAPDHNCDTCLAAGGDRDALVRILVELLPDEEK